MPITKTQALDKFCIIQNYDTTKLVNETKAQFLARKQKEWALSIITEQINRESQVSLRDSLINNVTGLDV